MKLTSLFGLGSVILVAACASTPVTRQVPVDDTFEVRLAEWSTIGTARPPGIQTIAFVVQENDGIMEVCGAWAHEGTSGRESAYRAMVDTNVYVNGKLVIENISYFNKVKSRSQIKGGLANCANTGIPMPKGKIEADISSDSFGRYRI